MKGNRKNRPNRKGHLLPTKQQADGYFMDVNIVNTGKNAKSLLKMKMGKCIMT